MHFLSHSVSAVLCFDDRLVEKVREIIDVPICAENHLAAAPAVTTVGSTFRHKFLPPKAD
jgi:Asp/Glu/hydantoin racemase